MRAAPICFRTGCGQPAPLAIGSELGEKAAAALRALLPTLICGEESALLVFGRLADAADSTKCRDALARIAKDEAEHEALLRSLWLALGGNVPRVSSAPGARHFFRAAGDRDLARHFMRIAALDSALCTLLSHVRRDGRVLAGSATVDAAFARIHRDEATHVAVSLAYARRACGRSERMATAAEMRARFCLLLSGHEDALEALGADPDRLFRRLSLVPPSFGQED